MNKVFFGDCRDVMRDLIEQGVQVDSVVTDPPYELGFMGKKWDSTGIAFNPEVWELALQLLKPGGHLLAFAGSRTYHRIACAIEDAGFEIRDQVEYFYSGDVDRDAFLQSLTPEQREAFLRAFGRPSMLDWVYGSGFPKSLDVSKAIDKQRSEDVELVRAICRAIRAAMDEKGVRSRDLVQHFGNCHPRLIDHWAARDTDSQPSLPTWEQWKVLVGVLEMGTELDAEVWRLNERKGMPGDAWQNADVIGEHGGQTPGFGAHRFNVRDNRIREATAVSRQWQGWGTALKPAHEPIVVARKPLIGTVAENVLRFGTGAINVDGCRVPTDEVITATRNIALGSSGSGVYGGANVPGVYVQKDAGRWPANIIHDGSDEVLAAFPDAPGQMAAVGPQYGDKASVNAYGDYGPRDDFAPRGDAGSAARFFYCAKTTTEERKGSKHPTIKPTDLMRYLCRLVTPPGGLVLDPFGGSGSTGIAAIEEGMQYILIEKEPEHVADIDRRMSGTQRGLAL